MERTIATTGTLGADEQSVLGAKVAGRLQTIAVDVGTRVRRGDLLARIEPRDFELRLRQAAGALAQSRATLGLPLDGDDDQVELESLSAVKEAGAVLNESTRAHDRALDLSRSGILSRAEWDAAEAAHSVATTRYERALEEARTRIAVLSQRRAEYDIGRKQLADADIRAPFDGIVRERIGNVGEYVTAGAPVVSLVASDPLRLHLEVPERLSGQVEVGQGVRVRVEGDDRVYRGRIARLSPSLDERSRTLRVEADVPAQEPLRPGLFARAEIVVADRDDVLTVPSEALVVFAGIEKVLVAQGGKAAEKTVVTGRRAGDRVEIVSGIAAGDLVVLEPGGLRSGQPLAIAAAGR